MDELLREIQAEKEHIATTIQALKEASGRKGKTVIKLAAIVAFLQNAYNGIENILKRILKYEGISVHLSESWHKDLLDLSVDRQIISDCNSFNYEFLVQCSFCRIPVIVTKNKQNFIY
jgi:hypothetical protein